MAAATTAMATAAQAVTAVTTAARVIPRATVAQGVGVTPPVAATLAVTGPAMLLAMCKFAVLCCVVSYTQHMHLFVLLLC